MPFVYYLRENELETIENADWLPRRLEVARDYLLLMCYTAMRISDVKRISRSWLNERETLLNYRQVKTNKPARGAFTGPVREILEKYDFALPHISSQKLNVNIQKLGECLGLDRVIQYPQYKGGKPHYTEYLLWELMSSKIGRKTFVSRAILKRIPMRVIQEFTGHIDMRVLNHYAASLDEELDEFVDLL